jgi:hypothetical protein
MDNTPGINNINNIISSITALLNQGQSPGQSTLLFSNILNEMHPNTVETNQAHISFEEDTPQFRNILSDDGHALLKKKLYNKEECGDTCCSISLKEFDETTEVIALPCNHCFIEEPIMKWLTTINAICPICRDKLPSKEERIVKIEDHIQDHPTVTPGENINTIQSSMHSMMQRMAEAQYNAEQNDMQSAILASIDSFNSDASDI